MLKLIFPNWYLFFNLLFSTFILRSLCKLCCLLYHRLVTKFLQRYIIYLETLCKTLKKSQLLPRNVEKWIPVCGFKYDFLSNNITVGPTLQNSSFVSYRPYGRYLMFCFGDPSSLRSVGITLQRHPRSTVILSPFFKPTIS